VAAQGDAPRLPWVSTADGFLEYEPERQQKIIQRPVPSSSRDGEFDKAQVIRTFYDEYLAVNDLPAPFYLETVASFPDLRPAEGELTWHGRKVNLKPSARPHSMTVERG
jgi:poly-beta-hydroxyalkanoate depolymerase